MSKNKGYISLYRSIFDSRWYFREKFTRTMAWIDLLLLANHKPGMVEKRGNIIDIKRGQVGMSILGLSKRWRWSRTRTDRFLKCLENEHQVVVEKTKLTTVVTIVNYDKYQKTIQQKSNRKATEKQQKNTNNNNSNNDNNGNKKTLTPLTPHKALFDPFSMRPGFVTVEDWTDLVEHRLAIKKAVHSQRAYNAIIRELHKATLHGVTVTECIDTMVSRGWISFKYEYMEKRGRGNGAGHAPRNRREITDDITTKWAIEQNPELYPEYFNKN